MDRRTPLTKRVAIYARVSTADKNQTVENQLRDLLAVAERQGWTVTATFTDEGISGVKGRDRRPGYDSLLKGVARKDFDQIMAWSVDRLGRSLPDLVAFLRCAVTQDFRAGVEAFHAREPAQFAGR